MTDPAELARRCEPPEGTEPRGVRARQPIRRQVLFDMWAAHLSTKASHALADLYIESAGEAAERIDDICQLRGVGERTRAELVEFVGRTSWPPHDPSSRHAGYSARNALPYARVQLLRSNERPT